ncbi:MAG: 30S ribosomal protein S6 [Chloroflexi bacterium]|nr:30S ribosomal protein S6 [Chloroflexota bacterium]
MANYELVYILRPDLDENNQDVAADKVSRTVTSLGGQVAQLDKWGKRRLAYPLRRFQEGFFLVSQIQLEPEKVAEIDRSLRLDEEILRYSITRSNK